MLFGYTSAVIAGFLFTAIPNWTGRMPTRGWPLMVLAAIIRASAPPESGLWLAAGLWTAGFAAFVAQYAPILTTANAGRKLANPKVG